MRDWRIDLAFAVYPHLYIVSAIRVGNFTHHVEFPIALVCVDIRYISVAPRPRRLIWPNIQRIIYPIRRANYFFTTGVNNWLFI